MSRDPNRIPRVLDELRRTWEESPDLRLGQLLVNIAGEDPYYIEDDRTLTIIREYRRDAADRIGRAIG